jgi:hypothetical protein
MGKAPCEAVETDRKLLEGTARREDLASKTYSIELDFRRLVEALERTMDLADDSDEELMEQIDRTKWVAERGLRLSRLLRKLTLKPND